MLRTVGVFVFAGLVAATASAQVAMLTQVAGEVRVAGGGQTRDAVPFLKLNEGERLTLAAGARVQMVYLASGRQEVWTGTGAVAIGAQEGRSPSLTPQSSQVPPLILRQLAKTPAVGQHAKTGMVMLRSLDDLGAGDQLEQDYATYRAEAPPGDTTPEVFLLSGLIDIPDYDHARRVLATLRAKPQTPALTAVISHFSALIDEATRP